MEFLGDGSPADDRPAFDKTHLEAGTGQVKGADKAIMARADDDGVIMLGHIYLFSERAGA
jgi:hypothetical protein